MITLDRRLRGIKIHEAQLYGQGHLVHRWFEDLGQDYERNAKFFAPVNKYPKGPGKRPPGALKRSIRVTTTRRGPTTLRNELTIGVNYASFVVRGTSGPIFSNRASARGSERPPAMKVYFAQIPGFPGKRNGPFVFPYSVSGQRRNAFLDRAARATAKEHPSISGLGRRGIGL